MRKLLHSLSVLVCLSSLSTGTAIASSYMTVSENDTLRISPNLLNNYLILPVVANFDGVADHWRLEITHPSVLNLADKYYSNAPGNPDYGMYIPYTQSDGSDAVYSAVLTTIKNEIAVDTYSLQTIVESSTTAFGYWDYNNDGIYECYGTVKWGPGLYDRMFDLHFFVTSDCTGDSIIVSGMMTSTTDWRYTPINAQFNRVVYLRVAYQLGDVNGDETVSMSDITALIDYMMNQLQGMSQYQLDSADVNRDGQISLADVSALTDLLSSN